MTRRNLVAERLDAEFRETEARLEVLEAEAHARKASEDMEEIAGLKATRDRIRDLIAAIREETAENLAAARREAETMLHELEAGIERIGDRFAAWGAARERWFHASLEEAEAKVKQWKTRADRRPAGDGRPPHDELAALQERIAVARDRLAEWQRARHTRKAQDALEEAARQFEEAFDLASIRYEAR